jgi:rsbT antagonist protein RsbS
MARVPIVRLRDTLIASVPDDVRDRDARELLENLGNALERHGGRAIILDISLVDTMDSYLGRTLSDLASGARLFGAMTIVVGMRPAVAITLVELGLQLTGIRTALNLDLALEMVERIWSEEDRRAGHHAV